MALTGCNICHYGWLGVVLHITDCRIQIERSVCGLPISHDIVDSLPTVEFPHHNDHVTKRCRIFVVDSIPTPIFKWQRIVSILRGKDYFLRRLPHSETVRKLPRRKTKSSPHLDQIYRYYMTSMAGACLYIPELRFGNTRIEAGNVRTLNLKENNKTFTSIYEWSES